MVGKIASREHGIIALLVAVDLLTAWKVFL